jgi:hypothetical protein
MRYVGQQRVILGKVRKVWRDQQVIQVVAGLLGAIGLPEVRVEGPHFALVTAIRPWLASPVLAEMYWWNRNNGAETGG